MSLTWKLILGFLFAAVLQVAQMLTNGYFTSQLVGVSEKVASALRATVALQHSLDAVRVLRERDRASTQADVALDIPVHEVFFEETVKHATAFATELATSAPAHASRVRTSLEAATQQFAQVRRATAPSSDLTPLDELAFFDDALADLGEALQRGQVQIVTIAEQGISTQEEVKDVPMRAALAITVGGVAIMAVFVYWFSRQLVIPIQRAWSQLESRVEQRTAELEETVGALEEEIVERTRAEVQLQDMHRQLVEASRQAGMAELANGVLHNVGNVLNSVNVSANLIADHLRASRVDALPRVVALLRDNAHDLCAFLSSPRGRTLPDYLEQLGQQLAGEQQVMRGESQDLSAGLEHLKEIVHRQQEYARVMGTASEARLGELVDDVLRMHAQSLAKNEIAVTRRITCDDACFIDRSRVVQILLNLVKNAKESIGTRGGGGHIAIDVTANDNDDALVITVADDGQGIAKDDLARIFGHGFTTKRDGHGFGLHHSANSATEMGGRLWADSDGVGRGARFVLELPLRRILETV